MTYKWCRWRWRGQTERDYEQMITLVVFVSLLIHVFIYFCIMYSFIGSLTHRSPFWRERDEFVNNIWIFYGLPRVAPMRQEERQGKKRRRKKQNKTNPVERHNSVFNYRKGSHALWPTIKVPFLPCCCNRSVTRRRQAHQIIRTWIVRPKAILLPGTISTVYDASKDIFHTYQHAAISIPVCRKE